MTCRPDKGSLASKDRCMHPLALETPD